MKLLLLGVAVIGPLALLGIALVVAQRELRVSDAWLSERERQDLIDGNQWHGVVPKWPWGGDSDEAIEKQAS